jgi:hypothetical protein
MTSAKIKTDSSIANMLLTKSMETSDYTNTPYYILTSIIQNIYKVNRNYLFQYFNMWAYKYVNQETRL